MPHADEGSICTLPELLRRRRDEIVEAWEQKARAHATARDLSGPALRDHVPALLDQIAAILDKNRDPASALEDLADQHALERLEHGYDVSLAVAEMGLLRREIFQAWERMCGDPIPVPQARSLDEAIDAMIVRSVARFTAARERTLIALDRVSSAALGTGDLDAFLPKLLTVLLQTTEAADSAFVLLRDDEDVLRVRAGAGVDADLSAGFSVRIGEGFAGLIAQRGEPMLLHDAATNPIVKNPAVRDRKIHALFGVPLIREGRVIGVAKMASRSAYAFSEEDQQLFRTMARRATSLIVQAQLVAARDELIEILEYGDAFLAVDAQWRIVRVNATQERISRKHRTETLGRMLWEVWPETASPDSLYWREYQRCMRDRIPVAFEDYYAPLDLWTEVTAYPTRDGGIAVFFRDATARKRAEVERDRTAALLDTLIATAPVGLGFVDRDLRYFRINDALAAMNGVSAPETVGRTIREVLPDLPEVERLVRRVLETGEPALNIELTGTRPGLKGRSGHWLTSYYPVRDQTGAVFMVGAAVVDITDRKRAEDEVRRRESELQRLFAVTPDLLCLAGADGHLRHVNPAFTAVLGYSEEELLRMPYLELVHPDDRSAAEAEVQKILAGGQTERFLVRCRTKSGEDVWVSWNALPHPDMKGVFIAAGRDVTTERNRTEFDRQLTAIVSHDLRNPLTAILAGASTIVRREDLDDRTLRAVTRIRTAAERANRMIADLLDFTRARVGQGIPVRPAPTDIHILVREVVEEVQAAHPSRAIQVTCSGDGSGTWDRDRLAQVVTNLVVNAVKFSPPESVVAVSTRGLGGAVEIEVHNDGDPIPPELAPDLFTPYRRRREHGRASDGGLGLGLYIAQEIARSHGGVIVARSSKEEGTTFTVELPRKSAR